MRIGELSKMYGGVDKRTIDFYTNKGLLKGEMGSTSKFRDYDMEDVERLGKILIFREMGLSIEVIQQVINDPSYWTPMRLEEHIIMLKENQRRENERYELMIRFAEAMQETTIAPTAFLQQSGMPIEQYVKYWVTAYQWFKDNPGSYNDESEDIAQLNDMLESFISNITSKMCMGYQAQDVQCIVGRLSNRLQNYFGVILYTVFHTLAESDAVLALFGSELQDMEDEDIKVIKAIFRGMWSLCADWCRDAKSQDIIIDIKAMEKQYPNRFRQLSDDCDEYDIDFIEAINGTLSSMCTAFGSSNIFQMLIGSIVQASRTTLDERTPGLTNFITNAIDYYVSCTNVSEVEDNGSSTSREGER